MRTRPSTVWIWKTWMVLPREQWSLSISRGRNYESKNCYSNYILTRGYWEPERRKILLTFFRTNKRGAVHVSNPLCPICFAKSNRCMYVTTSSGRKIRYRCTNGHSFYKKEDYERRKPSTNPLYKVCGGRQQKKGTRKRLSGSNNCTIVLSAVEILPKLGEEHFE